MRRKITFEQGVAFLPGAKAMASFYTKTDDAASTKQVVPKDLTAYPWSWWGSDNLFPQKVVGLDKKSREFFEFLEKRDRHD
jgi:hypothetical protein